MAGPQRWLFDTWSYFYDLAWVQRGVYRAPQDAVLARLRRAGCRRVLDVGCGTGQLAARIRLELPGTTVVGCDFSEGMLRQAARRDAATGWVGGDASRLPFGSRTFDAVVSTEAFHWFPDQGAVLREFRRVLRPEGHLLLALVNPRWALAARVVHLASRAVGEPFYWPTAPEMRRLVRAAGFHAVRQAPLFRLPGVLLFPPVLTIATAREPRPDAVDPPRRRRRA